jgi:phage tail protein X
MMVYVVTRETRLDVLVADLMGTASDGAVEAVLAANPGLAAVGPTIPIGREIIVPDPPMAERTSSTRVWE